MNRLPGNAGMNEIELAHSRQTALRHPTAAPIAVPRTATEVTSDGPLQLMWRRRWIVMLMLVLCVAGAVAYLRVATPLYTGSARIMVTGEKLDVLAGGGGGGGGKTPVTIDFMAQQVALLTSGPVVEKALAECEAREMKSFTGIRDITEWTRRNLEVLPGRGDGTITIAINLPDPHEAAAVVNAVVNAYKADRVESNLQEKRLNALREAKTKHLLDYERAHASFLAFQEREGRPTFDNAGGENHVLDRLKQLSDELTRAEIDEMYKRVAYAGASNRMIAANELRKAESITRNLRAAVELQQDKARKLYGKAAEFVKLQDAELRSKATLDKIDEQLGVAITNSQNILWDIRPLEVAKPERKPSKPEPMKIVALAVVAGLMLGFAGAWLRERTDHRLSSIEEISQVLGLPVLSVIPSMPGRGGSIARGQKMHLESMSDVAEAFRTLRTVVYFSVPENKSKTILLTSPNPGEGKSTTASGLAIAMAKAGRRTLMIDADLRRPTLHRIFELGEQTGLSSVMAGKEPVESAIQHTAVEGLDVLPAGPIPLNPSEILNSKAFAELLVRLSQRYDHIVLDSPPVLPVTDARILGAICDVTIMVLRANKSTKRMSEYAADAMLGVGARVLGVVVNDVPRNRRGGYYGGYGNYGSYGYGRRAFEAPAAAATPPASPNGNGNGHSNGAQKRLPRPESSAA